jgi:hypothetical protein
MLSDSPSRQPHVVELTARGSAELFDDSAPLCLGKRVVCHEIEVYLLQQLARAPRTAPVKLRLVLPADEIKSANDAVPRLRAFFNARSAEEQGRLSQIFRQGRIAAGIGFVFLLLVNGIGEGIRTAFPSRIPEGIANGLEIFGWVAMWRPAELLLYDWLPVRRMRNDLNRLANMEVDLHPAP